MARVWLHAEGEKGKHLPPADQHVLKAPALLLQRLNCSANFLFKLLVHHHHARACDCVQYCILPVTNALNATVDTYCPL